MVMVSDTLGGTMMIATSQVNVPANAAFMGGGMFTGSMQTGGNFQATNVGANSNQIGSDVVTINFYPNNGQNNNSNGSVNLEHPITFTLQLSAFGHNMMAAGQEVCDGPVMTRIFPQAMCGYYDYNSSAWETDGCWATNVTETTVECACNHLTDFAVVFPNHNYVEVEDIRDVDSASIQRHPVGIVTIMVLYIIFFATFAYAYRFDQKEKADASLRQEKEAKWTATLGSGARMTFWKRYKSQLQKKHTWFSLYFRKKGSSYRSVDRTCATLISVLTIMSVNAFFYGQAQTWYGYVEIVIFSAICSFIPMVVLEIIFTRIGPLGYKDLFELDHGLRPVPTNHCCQCWAFYRLPSNFVWVVYACIATLTVVLSWYVIYMAFSFDTTAEFICSGRGSASWVVSVVITILVNIFIVQPLKIFLACVVLHTIWNQQRQLHRVELGSTSQTSGGGSSDSSEIPALKLD